MSFMLAKASEMARPAGDPKVLETGPSSLMPADRAGRMLGWFSFGLGLTELLAPKSVTRWLGVEGNEGVVRAFGAREIAAGVMCLSTNNDYGAWSRVAGDMLDLAALGAAYRDDNPKKRNVGIAMGIVAACTIADLAAAQSIRSLHKRKGPVRDFSDRSGFPKGVEAVRGAAAGDIPSDMHAAPAAVKASPVDGSTSPATAELQARERKEHPQPAL
jgi:hypothetical protein